MATAKEIRDQIAARRTQVQQQEREEERVLQEVDEAKERQRLRRELEKVDEHLDHKRSNVALYRRHRQKIDQDQAGPYITEVPNTLSARLNGAQREDVVQGVVDCEVAVLNGEIEFTIKGFSWLEDTLKQCGETCMGSVYANVGGHWFQLRYHPERGEMDKYKQLGSLSIFHEECEDYQGVVFRYTILIKSKERGYVQWGDSGCICLVDQDTDGMIFGPDVCKAPATPRGIFGMSHTQLMESEWVIDDVLTAKLKVEVRPDVGYDEAEESREAATIVVPSSSLSENLLNLLDSAAGSDVTFMVQGEAIRAHSQILSARSEVLQRQFSCGMQESTSKEVAIEDCEPIIFTAFLRYLYCDSFDSVEQFIENKTSTSSAAARGTSASGSKMSVLQQLLAISHKYQVTRLQVWCERQLGELISIEEACSVLLQAHLYEAQKLEEKCLAFIAANMTQVVKTEAFASLSQKWPQVSLKITFRVARMSEGDVANAMKVQEIVRKRKRDE